MISKFFKCVLLLSTWSLQVIAAEPYGPTELEAKSLPPYCTGDGAYWTSVLGPEIILNNHTCYGINRLNRYYKSTNSRDRKAQLETAVGEFGYSINHLPPTFKLMPEIYFYRGTAYKLLARHGEAVGDFLKTISLDPKYAKAYSELADVYASGLSRRDKALEIVTEGLRHNPQFKALQRRYTEFGGKLPYPEPIEKSVPTDEPQSEIKPETKAEAIHASEVTPGQDSDNAEPTEPTTPTPQIEPAKIGSPKNPHCRFCPD